MGVLDGVVSVKGEGAVLEVNVGHPIVTDGEFLAQLCPREGAVLGLFCFHWFEWCIFKHKCIRLVS